MRVIWKYRLDHRNEEGQVIEMPQWAKVLDVQMQGHVPVMWALVNPESPMVERRFVLVWTGEERTDLNNSTVYIATFQAGPTAWHLFEKFDDERPF